jgi:hypothetical protein
MGTRDLSPSMKKDIDKYVKNLEKAGVQNMQFFNKKVDKNYNIMDNFFHHFSPNALFDDMLNKG